MLSARRRASHDLRRPLAAVETLLAEARLRRESLRLERRALGVCLDRLATLAGAAAQEGQRLRFSAARLRACRDRIPSRGPRT